ncbi:MAG TPA: DUF433 domain-containing protein [Candidatus Sumerlaeota bacterium]|nr:DUF433 domain-containing protein [Candidatus Sumerlaeota bacterium]
MNLDRITSNPHIMGGKPCIRGMRFPVSRIIGLLASNESEGEILRHHPDLEKDDILQSLQYAALISENEFVELAR